MRDDAVLGGRRQYWAGGETATAADGETDVRRCRWRVLQAECNICLYAIISTLFASHNNNIIFGGRWLGGNVAPPKSRVNAAHTHTQDPRSEGANKTKARSSQVGELKGTERLVSIYSLSFSILW